MRSELEDVVTALVHKRVGVSGLSEGPGKEAALEAIDEKLAEVVFGRKQKLGPTNPTASEAARSDSGARLRRCLERRPHLRYILPACPLAKGVMASEEVIASPALQRVRASSSWLGRFGENRSQS